MRRSGALIAGSFASASILGLLLLAVVARWLDDEQNSQFLVVWALVFGVGAAMSAVEVETSRLASLASMARSRVSGQVGLLALTGAALGAVAVVVALTLAPGLSTIADDRPGTFVLVVVAVLAFSPLCLVRGVLLGSGQVAPYAWVVLGEALFRFVLAVLLLVLVAVPSLAWAVAAIAVGGLAWLPVTRRVVRAVDWRSADRSPTRALRVVSALGAANALTALMLSAYPALVTAVVGSSAGLGTLFAAVILSRVPLVAVTPLQAVVVPVATRMLHGGHHRRLRRLWGQVALGTLVVASVAFAAGWVAGPWAIRVFQGPGYDARPVLVAVLLCATCVLGVALLQGAVMVAAGRHLWVTGVWVLATTGTVGWLALGPGSAETRGLLALAFGTALAWAASSAGVLAVSRTAAVDQDLSRAF